MKTVIGIMIAMFVILIPFGGVWAMIFTPIIGGGGEQSFIYPIYGGIILLSGIIVGCTKMILDEISSLRRQNNNTDQQ